jgi:ZIP family zinc transporter
MSNPVAFAFAVTIGAGLATGIGAALGLFAKRTNHLFLALALGFSAGVMIYVSFVEILPKARDFLTTGSSDSLALLWMSVWFLAGLLLMALLYRVLPDVELPHPDLPPLGSTLSEESSARHGGDTPIDPVLLRAGVFVAIAIALHNFPEGIAVFFLTLDDAGVGIPVGAAIALHNIPEGIAVAIPLYYALGRRGWAFGLGLASGLAEPLGAVLGYLILQPFISDTLLGSLFAIVAGIMVYISLDSLLPAARQYGNGQVVIYGVIGGMAVMAASLLLFAF